MLLNTYKEDIVEELSEYAKGELVKSYLEGQPAKKNKRGHS